MADWTLANAKTSVSCFAPVGMPGLEIVSTSHGFNSDYIMIKRTFRCRSVYCEFLYQDNKSTPEIYCFQVVPIDVL